MKQEQPLLNALQVPLDVAIDLALKGKNATDGKRKVGTKALRSVMQFIAGFNSRSCWQSAETIARRVAMNDRQVRSALNVLVEWGLLERTGPQNRRGHSIGQHQIENLKQMLQPAAEECPVLKMDEANCPENARIKPDILQVQSGHFNSKCPVDPGISVRHRTNSEKEETTTEQLVVVVSSCGVSQAEGAVRLALNRGLDVAKIERMVDDWRRLPLEERKPGTLYNWLAKDGSYKPTAPKLVFRKLPSHGERKRAELIQYAKKEGWTHEQTQHAIQKIEDEYLGVEVVA